MFKESSLRIIAGKWRGRKMPFNPNKQLRPTPDRVRETLFNWLMTTIRGATCLDLFAGSGVLGFEAISRGAEKVISLEMQPEAANTIRENSKALHATELELYQTDTIKWLEAGNTEQLQINIAFVDPPYDKDRLLYVLSLLEEKSWLQVNSLIYFEQDQEIVDTEIPPQWLLIKQKQAGGVYYYLARKEQ